MAGRLVALWMAMVTVGALGTACGAPAGSASKACPPGSLAVVAAENFWGSIAAQLGGNRTCVVSVVANPNTDPHEYDATPADARLVARARYVILNGAGYDPWVPRLLGANPVPGRLTLDAAQLVGVPPGANPHLWYSPDYVSQVIGRITADYKALDPQGAAYFDQRSTEYREVALKDYRYTIATIAQRYSGVPVGASESIFVYLAAATGLDLVTPAGYMKAISEGGEPSAADKATVDEQMTAKRIRVFVYNSQNSTPDVRNAVDKARRAGIAVVPVTETLSPAGLTFQAWQTAELRALLEALGG